MNMVVGISNLVTKALRLASDVGSVKAFHLIPKVCSGVKVRAQCRPIDLFHTNLGKPVLMELIFCAAALSFLKMFWSLSTREDKY